MNSPSRRGRRPRRVRTPQTTGATSSTAIRRRPSRQSIVERGSHDQLMAQRGRYWQLYTGGRIAE